MKAAEYFIKNIIDKITYRRFAVPESDEQPVITSESKVLFIRLNRLGDALVTTPLLHQIKEGTGCRISVLSSSSNSAVFMNNDDVDEVAVYNKGRKGIKQALQYIRQNNFDCIVDLHDDVSTTVNYIIGKSSARYKFALHKENSLLFTHTVEKPDSRSHHVIERNLQLCRLFGLEPKESEARVRITLPEISLQKARQYIAKQYPGKKFLVGINISAGSDARFWGLRNFRALLKELKKYDVSYVIFCITRDLDYAIQITSERENIYYSPSLEDFSAVVSNVDLLFSPDTATVHIASAFAIPVFGLYVQYNTNDMIWSPYLTDFDYVLTKDATLKEMEAEPVINKFIPFLEKQLSKREQRNETSTEM